jgi:hypothetical protein
VPSQRLDPKMRRMLKARLIGRLLPTLKPIQRVPLSHRKRRLPKNGDNSSNPTASTRRLVAHAASRSFALSIVAFTLSSGSCDYRNAKRIAFPWRSKLICKIAGWSLLKLPKTVADCSYLSGVERTRTRMRWVPAGS